MKFYHLSQNNSGGRFKFDEEMGITHHVVIEADSSGEATYRAEEIGCYWDGVENDVDCACCGDRWYPPSEYSGKDFPHVYSTPLGEKKDCGVSFAWMKLGREIAVHYKDGRIEWYGADGLKAEESK
jgi:hypothetical protein